MPIVHVCDDDSSVGRKFPRVQVVFDDFTRQRTAIHPRSVESTFGGKAAEDVGAEGQGIFGIVWFCGFGVEDEYPGPSTQYPVPSTQ